MKLPQLRFEGYTELWKQSILNNVSTIVSGGTPDTNNIDYWNGNINWLSPMEIKNDIFIKNSKKKISTLGLKKSSAKLLPVGTILFTSRAGIGKTAILSKEACTNQGFQSIVPKKKLLDSYFTFSMTNKLKKYGNKMGSGSTFNEISGKQMGKMKIFIPKINEQEKIGSFFQKLDQLIELQSQKVTQLKQLKRGFLQKLYPAKGASLPLIRFSKFNNNWNFKSIADVSVRLDSYRIPISENNRTSGSTRYYGANGVVDYVDGYTHSGKLLLIAEDGANSIEDYPIYYVNGKIWVNNHAHVLSGKIGFSTLFLSYQLKTVNIYPFLVGTGRYKLNADSLMSINLLIPSLPEQQKIGTFFQNIDQQITIQQSKLEHLKQLKKGYLQNMFI